MACVAGSLSQKPRLTPSARCNSLTLCLTLLPDGKSSRAKTLRICCCSFLYEVYISSLSCLTKYPATIRGSSSRETSARRARCGDSMPLTGVHSNPGQPRQKDSASGIRAALQKEQNGTEEGKTNEMRKAGKEHVRLIRSGSARRAQ